MRILLISDYETQGGAAIACQRLANAMSRTGADVVRMAATPGKGPREYKFELLPRKPIAAAAGQLAEALGAHGASRALRRWESECQLRLMLQYLQPDVINLHNVHGAGWHTALLAACCEAAPVVWTLHDMWSFTGRCSYAFECRKFVSGCDHTCPTPAEYPAKPPHEIGPEWTRRAEFFLKHSSIRAITPSRWLATEAERGMWNGHSVQVVPNGLPLTDFTPVDRVLARQALGLPPAKTVLLFVADYLNERRKGGDLLKETLARLSEKDVLLLTLGGSPPDWTFPEVKMHHLGSVDHRRMQCLAYSAADLLIHPAPVDNLPNVVVEAMAAGTPTLALPVGGLPELVRPGTTGWLAAEASGAALAAALTGTLADLAAGRSLRAECRAVAEAEYGDTLMAERYLQHFRA